ncbi:MAG: hypothetical protein V2A73_22450 [Pseudomonadota bacterium]
MAHRLWVARVDDLPPGKGKTVFLASREITVYNHEGRYVATSTWPRHLVGQTETVCEMPGHRFDAEVEFSPATLHADDLHYIVVVEGNSVFVVIEDGHVHPGAEPRA